MKNSMSLGKQDFSGSTEITSNGIKKHFASYDPVRALSELIWNGLDAGANLVSIETKNDQIGGTKQITVLDNGEGIDVEKIDESFKKFDDSSKKYQDDMHGSNGRGRLAFHRLCNTATWYTRRGSYDAKIIIKSHSIKDYKGLYILSEDQHRLLHKMKMGTCVELEDFHKSLPDEKKIEDSFSKNFGWRLALNCDLKIEINGNLVTIPEHEIYSRTIQIDEKKFNVKAIIWKEKPNTEKSYNYVVNKSHKIINRELSKFNNKPGFYLSTYVSSDCFDELDLQNFKTYVTIGHEFGPIYNKLKKELLEIQKEIHSDFLRRFADQEITKLENGGCFPEYKGLEKNYALWRKNYTKSILKSIYIADPKIFNSLNSKQSKIFISLLDKLLVSNENNGLWEILEGVLDLDKEHLAVFAAQLSKTTVENIVSTIEVLQKRDRTIHELRELIGNRFNEILETPDLQKIIESNTWLFGEQYATIGAEEDTFQAIARELRDKVKGIKNISEEDIETGSNLEGVNRQVDLFLARRFPFNDSVGQKIYKCVIVEIKRPGISLNKTHLRQLDDYAEIIAKHAPFGSDKMRFELILIGRKISGADVAIQQRLEGLNRAGEQGLVTSTPKIKCYVKNWFSIFDEFELMNDYLLSKLNIKFEQLTNANTEELVNGLQQDFRSESTS